VVRPQAAIGGDGVHILTVAATNVLNNVFQTANKGWFFSLGVGRWPTNPNREKLIIYYEMIYKASDFDI
jgi:hypothetical protein